MTNDSLESQAARFASELTETVQVLSRDSSPFHARAMSRPGRPQAFTGRQEPSEGITLEVDGQPLLRLTATFQCTLDGQDQYLTVRKTEFKVMVSGEREPLFRYDYLRDAPDGVPAAHVQLHAHRDATTHAMNRAGRTTRRGASRADSDEVARVQDLHFPVGGHRFRPCLEDVLEMLVHEFGVDSARDGLQTLRIAREKWRRTQTRTVVRDAPEEAVAVLEDLGYTVTPSEAATAAAGHPGRLREL